MANAITAGDMDELERTAIINGGHAAVHPALGEAAVVKIIREIVQR